MLQQLKRQKSFSSRQAGRAVGAAANLLPASLAALQLTASTTHTCLRYQQTCLPVAALPAAACVLATMHAQVQVKAADASISKEAREALVDEFSQVLTTSIPALEPDR